MTEIKVVPASARDRRGSTRYGLGSARDPMPARPPRVVAIGASAGGPQALRQMLACLPVTFPLPVLVVQHLAPGFAPDLVEWLRPLCGPPVGVAAPGQRLDGPGIFVAPTGHHLVVHGQTLALASDSPVAGHRPSATVLFRSIARSYGGAAIGIILTGMGDDGAAGLRDLKLAGGVTIAQDEVSSRVFGMPAAAIGLGVVDYVLPPAEIGGLLDGFVSPGSDG